MKLRPPQIQYTQWTWDPDDILESLDVGDLVPEYGTFEETVSESTYDTISLQTRNLDQAPCLATQDRESRDLIFGCREEGGWVMETVASEGFTGAQPALAINDADEYFMTVDDGTLDIQSGEHDDPSVSLSTDSGTLKGVLSGELNGMQAFMSGRLKASGNLMLATKLNQLFP